MRLAAVILLIAPALLAGCQSTAELEQAAAAARIEDCKAAGFAEGSDAFRLCLLIKRTDERIERVERRIDFLDAELSRAATFGWWRRWPP